MRMVVTNQDMMLETKRESSDITAVMRNKRKNWQTTRGNGIQNKALVVASLKG